VIPHPRYSGRTGRQRRGGGGYWRRWMLLWIVVWYCALRNDPLPGLFRFFTSTSSRPFYVPLSALCFKCLTVRSTISTAREEGRSNATRTEQYCGVSAREGLGEGTRWWVTATVTRACISANYACVSADVLTSEQQLIMLRPPLIYHGSVPVSTHRNVHNLTKSIMLPTQTESWDFIQNVHSWYKRAFTSFFEAF
jgi:hypothetical protein